MSEPIWRRMRSPSIVVASIVAALAVRGLLDTYLGDRQPFVTFYCAVTVAAWFAGTGASIVTLLIGFPLVGWFFLAPRHTLLFGGMQNAVVVAAYFTVGATIVAFGASLRRAAERTLRRADLSTTEARELAQEHKRLEKQLDELRTELRAMGRRREEFVEMLAHELRRPLVPIASAASLHDVAATAAEMEAAMDVVKHEMTRLGGLIDDLLDLFRASAPALETKRLDLCDSVAGVARQLGEVFAQSGRELTVSLAKEPVWIQGQPGRLQRALANLLLGALRTTRHGGNVWISARREEGDAVVRLRTSDATPGTSAARVPQSPSGAWNTLGLLAIQRIVELHGGRVEVRQPGSDGATEFALRLPLCAVGADVGTTPSTHETAGTSPDTERGARPHEDAAADPGDARSKSAS